MISHLPTNTEVEIELADGTKLTNLRTNGNNFVSDTPIEDSVFEGNLSTVKITTPEGVTEYKDLKLVQNRQFGDVYMFVLAEKTPAEKEKEELLQLIADLAELTLEVALMDERKLRLYKFLLKMGRITIDEVPEPYKSEIEVTDGQK